jgi:hypothetical protein
LGWNWHLSLKPEFNRLPWCHGASPSTTRYESVKSTDTDKLMSSWQGVKWIFSGFFAKHRRRGGGEILSSAVILIFDGD